MNDNDIVLLNSLKYICDNNLKYVNGKEYEKYFTSFTFSYIK